MCYHVHMTFAIGPDPEPDECGPHLVLYHFKINFNVFLLFFLGHLLLHPCSICHLIFISAHKNRPLYFNPFITEGFLNFPDVSKHLDSLTIVLGRSV
jgi:hypothetical protein